MGIFQQTMHPLRGAALATPAALTLGMHLCATGRPCRRHVYSVEAGPGGHGLPRGRAARTARPAACLPWFCHGSGVCKQRYGEQGRPPGLHRGQGQTDMCYSSLPSPHPLRTLRVESVWSPHTRCTLPAAARSTPTRHWWPRPPACPARRPCASTPTPAASHLG